MADFTRKAIKETFMRLLNEKPLKSITVSELARECGINRNTIYYYYPGIPELFEEILKEELDRVIETSASLETLEERVINSFSIVLENKQAIHHIYNSVQRDVFERYLMESSEYAITEYLKMVLPELDVSDIDTMLLIKYLKYVCFGSIIEWLEKGEADSLETEIHRSCEIVDFLFKTVALNGLEA